MSGMRFTVPLSPQSSPRITNGSGHPVSNPGTHKFLEFKVAKLKPVQSAVESKGKAIAARAEANLQRHRKTGASKIEFSRGVLDAHITLSDRDSKSPAAAMIEIETGALHHAAKLPRLARKR